MIKRVFLGVSGGVDSAVAACLLKEQGVEVVGVHLVVGEHTKDSDAKRVCDFVGINYVEIEVKEQFREKIEKPFLQGYQQGETPSPCLWCNPLIKFETLATLIESDEDAIATGHYAQTIFCETIQQTLLQWKKGYIKDQSYMLYRLTPEILKRLLFPLMNREKSEIREIAKQYGVPVFNKKDSQNLCFAKQGYITYLNQYSLGKHPGAIVTQSGEVIGTHQGYEQYTLGQRKGLNLQCPTRTFVVDIIPDKNEVVVGSYEMLAMMKVKLREVILHTPIQEGEIIVGRPRSSSQGSKGTLKKENEKIYFVFETKNYHCSRGQHLVFYTQDHVLIGGGIIDELHRSI